MKPTKEKLLPGALLSSSAVLSAVVALVVFLTRSEGSWLVMALGRLLVGGVFALTLAKANAQRCIVWPEAWGWARIVAAAIGVPSAFFALVSLSPTDAITLMMTAPIWAVVLEACVEKRLPQLPAIAALGLAAAGLVILERPAFSAFGLAAPLALLHGACRGVGIVGASRMRHTPATVQIYHANLGATLSTLIIFLTQDFTELASSFQLTFFGWVLLVGLVGTSANILATKGLGLSEPAKVAPLLYLAPALAFLFEAAALNIESSWTHKLGLTLILGASLYSIVSQRGGKKELVLQGQA